MNANNFEQILRYLFSKPLQRESKMYLFTKKMGGDMLFKAINFTCYMYTYYLESFSINYTR